MHCIEVWSARVWYVHSLEGATATDDAQGVREEPLARRVHEGSHVWYCCPVPTHSHRTKSGTSDPPIHPQQLTIEVNLCESPAPALHASACMGVGTCQCVRLRLFVFTAFVFLNWIWPHLSLEKFNIWIQTKISAQSDNNNLKLWVEVHLEADFDLVSRPATWLTTLRVRLLVRNRLTLPGSHSHFFWIVPQAGSVKAKHHVQTINLEPYNFANPSNAWRFVCEVRFLCMCLCGSWRQKFRYARETKTGTNSLGRNGVHCMPKGATSLLQILVVLVTIAMLTLEVSAIVARVLFNA